MNTLKVKLWGEELGTLVFNPASRSCYFYFNPRADSHPDISPILHPVAKMKESIPIPSDDRRLYQGLPPFIADSLPDSWGNRLFDRWVRENHIPSNKITPLYKLMFIGRRGMGALEFEPAAKDLEYSGKIDIGSLYRMSLEVFDQRKNMASTLTDNISKKALLAVGTSAGGRQMKAVLAYNPQTGELRSGQVSGLENFKYYIVKFEDPIVPTAEIEMAYYEMATKGGIDMQECRLLEIEGKSHFMTLRFDREDDEKVFTQTLAAINPDVDSYEGLFITAKRLGLMQSEIKELFRRMVFNVMSNNTDDHNKNFSFMLRKGGCWQLAPAYDMTFIFNIHGTDRQEERCFTLNGKNQGIEISDLLILGKEYGIQDPKKIIMEIADSLREFPRLAEKYRIPKTWANIIKRTLNGILTEFGINNSNIKEFTDDRNRKIKIISIKINQKGFYEVRALKDGTPVRRFIKENQPEYDLLDSYQSGTLNSDDATRLFFTIFQK